MRAELNLPNRITLARLLGAVGVFVLLAEIPESGDQRITLGWAAFSLFVLVAATDWLDGFLARKLGAVTVFGRIMDPFVDKVVVCGTFILLLNMPPASDYLPAWIVVVVVAREFFVSSIRGYVESKGLSFAAEWSGKVKMLIQCVAVSALLFLIPSAPVGQGQAPPDWIHVTATVAVWGTLLSTVQSGVVYLVKAVRMLGSAES